MLLPGYHNLTVLSWEALAITCALGEKVTALMLLVCPSSIRFLLGLAMFQSESRSSLAEVTIYFLSVNKSTSHGWKLQSWFLVWCWCLAEARIPFPCRYHNLKSKNINVIITTTIRNDQAPYNVREALGELVFLICCFYALNCSLLRLSIRCLPNAFFRRKGHLVLLLLHIRLFCLDCLNENILLQTAFCIH